LLVEKRGALHLIWRRYMMVPLPVISCQNLAGD
jgi:hypothetical protein